MGLFDAFKSKSKNTEKKPLLLAMPMFNNGETFDAAAVIEHLRSYWKLEVSSDESAPKVDPIILTIDGETVALATMPAPIPDGDIHGTADYAYNWPTAKEDLKNHNTHVIVTLLSSESSHLERFQVFTKVLASILATTQSQGVYYGTQSLLIPRDEYLESAEALHEEKIPLTLWIYIGIRKSGAESSLYTYGLKSFDKLEIEIINSKENLGELYDFLSNVCAYVIDSDVTFNHGETFGYTAEQKIKITKSKGKFVEGETLKLAL